MGGDLFFVGDKQFTTVCSLIRWSTVVVFVLLKLHRAQYTLEDR